MSFCEIEVDEEVCFRASTMLTGEGKENRNENLCQSVKTDDSTKVPSNLRSSWDLPTSFQKVYGSNETITLQSEVSGNCESSPTKDNWDLPSAISQAYVGMDVEHVAKYSEAEHSALLTDALSDALMRHREATSQSEVVWKEERDCLLKKLTEAEQSLSLHAEKLSSQADSLRRVQDDLGVSNMQTKALTLRVQVCSYLLFLCVGFMCLWW